MTRRKKKCERYGEGEDDDDEDCACELVKKGKTAEAESEHIGDQRQGESSQETPHQVAGDDDHTVVNGSGRPDGALTSKDTVQGLVSLTT